MAAKIFKNDRGYDFKTIYVNKVFIFGADAILRFGIARSMSNSQPLKCDLTAIVLSISLTSCFGRPSHQIVSAFCKMTAFVPNYLKCSSN